MFEHELKNAYIGEVWTPGSNTLLYLPLEKDATDYSGNSIGTTPTNITYASLGGVMCANANGSSSKIQITNTSFLTSSQTEGTCSMLVYTSARPSSTGFILSLDNPYAHSGFFIRSTGNHLSYNNGWGADLNSGEGTIGTWIHLLFTFDSSSIKLYTNGVLADSNSTRNTSNSIWGKTPDVTGFYLFANRGGNNNRWKGGGRELIIENKKWSADYVANYYNQIKQELGF